MSFEHVTGFRICGAVVRKFVNPQGTFASVTIEAPNARGRMEKYDVKCFSDGPMDEFRELGQGQTIQVTGNIAMSKLTAKNKEAVKVDGYDKWLPDLVAKAVKVEVAGAKPAPRGWDEGGKTSGGDW